MAFGEIRHGAGNGIALTAAAEPDEGPYFVEGKAGTTHGPFDRWTEASQERDRVIAELRKRRALRASQLGLGR